MEATRPPRNAEHEAWRVRCGAVISPTLHCKLQPYGHLRAQRMAVIMTRCILPPSPYDALPPRRAR